MISSGENIQIRSTAKYFVVALFMMQQDFILIAMSMDDSYANLWLLKLSNQT